MPVSDPLGIHKPGSKLSRVTDPLGVNAPPVTADTSPLTALHASGDAALASLEAERAGLLPSRDQQMATRLQQQGQIPGLQAAVAGTAPSAAEIAGRQAATAANIRQMQMAATLRRNPAAALQAASQGAAGAAGQVAEQAGAARANEIFQARGTLGGALQGMRGADIGLQTADQQARDRNMAALLAQRQLQQQIAAGKVNADQIAAGAQNARDAAIIGAAGTGIGTYAGSLQRPVGVRDEDGAALGRASGQAGYAASRGPF